MRSLDHESPQHGAISVDLELITWYDPQPQLCSLLEGFIIHNRPELGWTPKIRCRGRQCFWRIPLINGDLEVTLLALSEHRTECGKNVRPRKHPVDLPFTIVPKESNAEHDDSGRSPEED